MSIVKIVGVFSLLAVLVHIADSISLIDKYRDSIDKLDIDSLLKNPVLVNSYVNCLSNKGPCTKYGKDIKSK